MNRVERVQGLRRSGAAGRHDSRPNRLRTRTAEESAAIEEEYRLAIDVNEKEAQEDD